MTHTSPKVQFGLYGLEIKEDSIPSSTSALQPFVDLDELRTGNIAGRPYATYEPDYWLLDGTFKFKPATTPHVGMMSLNLSNENGDFGTWPILTIDFSTPHTTDGLTLRFGSTSGDYANQIRIRWYDSGAVLLDDNTYHPDSAEWSIALSVVDFQQIVITFYSTNRPYRYLRLLEIDYGVLLTFEGESIKAASVIEETDPLSAELRMNALELELFSTEADFSIMNPSGAYAGLKEHQPIMVYETINNLRLFMGRYFLCSWENTSENKIKFAGTDLIGLMDDITTRGGLWLAGDAMVSQNLIAALLGAANIPYDFDPTLNNIPIIGWLPVGSLRTALQQIAFVIGATVDCSRSWSVKITPIKIAEVETEETIITSADKGASSSVKLRPQIAGVEVTTHEYVENATSRDLYSGTLAAGNYEILFDQPAHDLSISGATITSSGANYALINVAAPGAVTLSGQGYEDTKQVYKIDNPAVTGSIRTVKRVTAATLVNADNVADVAQRVYDYHVQPYLQTLKLFAPPAVELSSVLLIDALYGQQIRGVVEKMSIDLAMGMVAAVEVVGVKDV